jgi:hypothetical protein
VFLQNLVLVAGYRCYYKSWFAESKGRRIIKLEPKYEFIIVSMKRLFATLSTELNFEELEAKAWELAPRDGGGQEGRPVCGRHMEALSSAPQKVYKYTVLTKRGRPETGEDARNRGWGCGCGKVYLTYGALYSHTRVKHGGVQPPGSVRLRDENRRPRVEGV